MYETWCTCVNSKLMIDLHSGITIQELVHSHTSVHYIPQGGFTALHAASACGRHKVVDLLTNAGAAVDVQMEVNIDVIVTPIIFG